MHISIGAAILILGLLYLATSKAGLKVLLSVALVGGVGLFAALAMIKHDTAVNLAANAAQAQEEARKEEALRPLKQDCAAIHNSAGYTTLAARFVALHERGCPGY